MPMHVDVDAHAHACGRADLSAVAIEQLITASIPQVLGLGAVRVGECTSTKGAIACDAARAGGDNRHSTLVNPLPYR